MRSKSIDLFNRILFFFLLLFVGLYLSASVLIPLLFGMLFAMLMHTVANYLEKKGLGRGTSSLLCTLTVFLMVIGLVALLVRQLMQFSEDLPQLQKQISGYYEKVRGLVNKELGVSYAKQGEFIRERGKDLAENAGKMVRSAIAGMMSMFLGFLLSLVYMFLMLMNRGKYALVLEQLVKRENRRTTLEIGKKVSKVAQKYLWGRIQVMSVLAFMYLIAFWAFGIKYAVLLTVFGALVTIIPYIGPVISGVLPVLTALLTGMEFGTVIIFAVTITIIQLIEDNIVEPVLMGSQVDLSPFSIILIILVGGSIWGVAGMILFVPILAMAKIYFDHMENLKPYGDLIGNDNKAVSQLVKNLLTKTKRSK